MNPNKTAVKRVGVLTAGLMALALCLFAMPAFAATADTETSTATVTLQEGALTLTAVPSFDFGSHPIAATMAFAAAADGVVQVSDLRGTGEGWNLTVALTNFTQSANTDSLPSANIAVSAPTVAGSDMANPAVGAGPYTLNCGAVATKVLAAEANKGLGIWTSTWSASNTLLNIPVGSAIEGTHNATLNWTLADAP